MKHINKLIDKTTNNFHINELNLDIDLDCMNKELSFDISNSNKLLVKSKFIKKELNTKLGIPLKNYLDIEITIPNNIRIDENIIITFNLAKDILYDKITFNYLENSYCNFIINYNSKGDNCSYHVLCEVVNASNNSTGSITLVNNLNSNSFNGFSIEESLDNNSNITHNIIDIGSNIKLSNIYGNVLDNASSKINSIYLGKDENIIDIYYQLYNKGKSSINDVKVEGVLDNKSRKVFRGVIDFLEGSSKSIGREVENCLLLSDSCIERSLPALYCHEEDVTGSHGASVGKIDIEKLFYLMSRGYSLDEAKKVLILGRFNKILNDLDESIKNIVIDKLDEYL